MSWNELKIANDKKILSVQSHAMTHTCYPNDSNVIDYHHPNDGYYWLDWNYHKEYKPYYLEKPQESNLPWGVPIYKMQNRWNAGDIFQMKRNLYI